MGVDVGAAPAQDTAQAAPPGAPGHPTNDNTPQLPRESFWRAAMRPQMLGTLVFFLTVAVICGLLGNWQLSRAQERGALATQQELAQQQGVDPIGAELAPQSAIRGELIGRAVQVTGTYEDQFLVPGRSIDGQDATLVLTGLRVSDDGTGGASWANLSGVPILPVVRGWVAPGTAADDPGLVPPSGVVTVTVWLQASEESGAPIADGIADMISSAQLLSVWDGPTYDAYGVLDQTSEPTDSLVNQMPRPTVEGKGEGLNIQNLFYAFEWWIFAGFAVAIWVRMVRDHRGQDIDPLAV